MVAPASFDRTSPVSDPPAELRSAAPEGVPVSSERLTPAPPPAVALPGASPAGEIFDSVLTYSSELYKGNREILRESYLPSRLPHREHQIRQVAEILAPALKGVVPSNLLIYGKI